MQFFTILWVCGAVVPHRKTTLKLIVMDTFFPHFNIAYKKKCTAIWLYTFLLCNVNYFVITIPPLQGIVI